MSPYHKASRDDLITMVLNRDALISALSADIERLRAALEEAHKYFVLLEGDNMIAGDGRDICRAALDASPVSNGQ